MGAHNHAQGVRNTYAVQDKSVSLCADLHRVWWVRMWRSPPEDAVSVK
jgi:hypothetical protein